MTIRQRQTEDGILCLLVEVVWLECSLVWLMIHEKACLSQRRD